MELQDLRIKLIDFFGEEAVNKSIDKIIKFDLSGVYQLDKIMTPDRKILVVRSMFRLGQSRRLYLTEVFISEYSDGSFDTGPNPFLIHRPESGVMKQGATSVGHVIPDNRARRQMGDLKDDLSAGSHIE